jgi:hypothetical protein
MGTGVGEAMLIGAVTGAGTSAITGGDPLKGALFGAAGGGAMSGLGGALGGQAAGAGSATAGQVAGQLGVQGASTAAGSQAAQLASQMQGFGTAGLEATRSAAATALPGLDLPAQIGQSGIQASLPNVPDVPKTGLMDLFKGATDSSDKREFGQRLGDYLVQNPMQASMLGGIGATTMLARQQGMSGPEEYNGPLRSFRYDPRFYRPAYASGGPIGTTDQGIAGTEKGMYPQSQFAKTQYAVPSQMPTSEEVIASGYEPRVNPYTGEPSYASGGITDLGGYSDGGRLLKGPGDGMSDSIPARIGSRQPARLADGEFVVPADVVSGLGNGSTDAGAKQLYAMMDKVRRDRTGTKKQGKQIKPQKYMPA